MSMTIPEAVRWQQQLGHAIHLPTPPACEQLMARARKEGIPVGNLYVVSQPLEPGSIGTSDRASGDLCCVYDARLGEEGQREVLRTLLLLIARVMQQFPSPQTITEDWAQVQTTIEKAYDLAQRWGQVVVFSADDLRALLTQALRSAMSHHAAAKLAGHDAPAVVRHAYVALQAQRHQYPDLADDVVFLSALEGSAEDYLSDVLLDFDRSLLRERWSVTSSRGPQEPASYGELALPSSPYAARTLRSALRRAMAMKSEQKQPSSSREVRYLQISEESDLAEAVQQVNTWLIDIHPQAAARLLCWVYGDASSMVVGAAHVYRLVLSYEDLSNVGAIPSQELWLLFSDRRVLAHRACEGAWQRFLLSWLSWSELLNDDLATGLRTLWEMLGSQA